jgi:hypothetical protein
MANLVSLDQVRAFLSKDSLNTADDALLLTLIAAASARFETQTGGRTFVGDVPGDVQLGVLQAVAVYYKARGTVGLAASTSGTGNVESYLPIASQLSGFDEIITNYRLWSVG